MQVLERTVRGALRHDCLGRSLAHAPDAGKAEDDALVGGREVLAGLVDVRRKDLGAVMVAGRDVVYDLVGLAHVGREDRGHVLLREVGLQPCCLHDEDRVSGGVRLVERVRRELEDVVPDLLCDVATVAVGLGAVHPVVVDRLVRTGLLPVEDLVGQHLDLLLCHGLAHARVGLARREAGHLHRDLHDLLLVDHGAIGLFQDRLQPVVVVGDLLLSVHALDVAVDHAGAQGAGTVERDESDDLLVLVGLHVLDGCGHAARLDLEDARGLTRTKKLIDFRVREVDLVHVDVDAGRTILQALPHGLWYALDVRRLRVPAPDVRERLVDDRQGSESQEVHLEQAHVRDRVALVLGDGDVPLRVELRRHVVRDGRRRDEGCAGVDALAAHEALDREGRVDDAVCIGVLVVCLLEVRRVLVRLLLVLVECVRQGQLGVVREHLRELLAHEDREAQDAVRVVNGLLCLDCRVRDDLAHVVLAVDVTNVLEHVLKVLIVEVHVDIGHLGTLRREEPLEHQAVLERIEVRDVHGVRDDCAGGGTAPRAYADAVVLRPLHVVLDDEEVVREALLRDDLVLVLEAVLHVPVAYGEVAPVLAVAPREALLALLAEALLGGLPGTKPRVLRQVHARPVELVVALVRNLERGVRRLGAPREEAPHLLFALHVELGALHAHAVGIVERGGLSDAAQDVLRRGVLACEVVEVVGADDLDALLVGKFHQVLVELAVVPAVAEREAMVLDLHVEVVAKQRMELPGPIARLVELPVQHALLDDALHARALADKPLVVPLEHAEDGVRFAVVHHLVAGSLRHALQQVVVTGRVLR